MSLDLAVVVTTNCFEEHMWWAKSERPQWFLLAFRAPPWFSIERADARCPPQDLADGWLVLWQLSLAGRSFLLGGTHWHSGSRRLSQAPAVAVTLTSSLASAADSGSLWGEGDRGALL